MAKSGPRPLNAGVRRAMRANKSTGTKPELAMRSELAAIGLHGSRNCRDVRGKPDFAFKREKVAVFVHGCFWHRHGRHGFKTPAHNSEFWKKKFRDNVRRDREVRRELKAGGWTVVVVWECMLEKNPRRQARRVLDAVNDGRK